MSEQRDKVMNVIGLVLLAVCFVVALLKVFSREQAQNNPDTIRISFAHWQLEGGLRETFDEIADRFEQIQLAETIEATKARLEAGVSDPGEKARLVQKLADMEAGKLLPVVVEQMPVPETVYEAWLKTRLVGEVAPHLIALRPWAEESMVATYFKPLGRDIEEPNTFNQGTPLETMKWRDTFVDGLRYSGFKPNLMEYYTIPCSVLTMRMFYNADILRSALNLPEHAELKAKLAKTDGVPTDYRDFIALCQAIRHFAEQEGKSISPISGSRYNVPVFLNQLYACQTQKLRLEEDHLGDHTHSELISAIEFTQGKWDLSAPAPRSAFQLVREIGQYMKPGFLQMNRDDAVFDFVQGRAAMIATGAWDAPSLRIQAGDLFDIGVFQIPIPSPEDPVYGKHVRGRVSEARTDPAVNFGVVLNKPEAEQKIALDFLRYLTSFDGAKVFTDGSGWLPATVEVEPKEEIKVFQPVLDGFPPGYYYQIIGNNETARIMDSNMHELLKANGSVDAFIQATNDQMIEATRYALGKYVRNDEKMVERQDVQIGLYDLCTKRIPSESEEMRKRMEVLVDSQHVVETKRLFLMREIGEE